MENKTNRKSALTPMLLAFQDALKKTAKRKKTGISKKDLRKSWGVFAFYAAFYAVQYYRENNHGTFLNKEKSAENNLNRKADSKKDSDTFVTIEYDDVKSDTKSNKNSNRF